MGGSSAPMAQYFEEESGIGTDAKFGTAFKTDFSKTKSVYCFIFDGVCLLVKCRNNLLCIFPFDL